MEVSTDAISDGRVKELHAADAVEERRTNCLRPRRGDVGGSVLGKSGTAGIALPPSEQGQTLVTFRLCHSELGLGNRWRAGWDEVRAQVRHDGQFFINRFFQF
jgi:hypothetical protein